MQSFLLPFLLRFPLLAAVSHAASVYKDFGQPNDFSASEKMFFEAQGSDTSGIWYLPGPDFAPHHGAFFENATDFWWTGAPSKQAAVISARTVMFRRHATLRVKGEGLDRHAKLHLTVRFKDQCRPGKYSGVPVFSRVGNRTILLGTLGGKDDKRWKTETLILPGETQRTSTGDFVFTFGTDYQDHLLGEFPIDKIKLSEDPDRAEFEPDAAGLWPEPDSAHLRFPLLGRTQEYVPGQGAFFPFGFYSVDHISDGGSAQSGGRGENDTWEIMERAHVNTCVVHGWEQNWNSQWNVFPDEARWAAPGVHVEPGIKELLVQARDHHIRLIPNPLTDTRAGWVQREGGAPAALCLMKNLAASLRNHPGILAYNPVDEFDHGDPVYGKPHTFVRQLFQTFKDTDPSRPVFTTLMGFMGRSSWQLAAETADILATDTYFDDYANEGGLEHGAALVASRLDDARIVLGDSKALWQVAHFGEGPEDLRVIDGKPRVLNAAEILFQGYLGIVHGAQGLLYFRFIHPKNPAYAGLNSTWEGFRQMGRELFGGEGIAPFLIPPAVTLDIMGERRKVSCNNANIHFILKKAKDGTQILIAVNTKQSEQRATFTVSGLERAKLPVHFENRSIPVSKGSFTDTFGRFARRVYVVSGDLNVKAPLR